MLIVPELKNFSESLALSEKYRLGFEYDDFFNEMDDTKAINHAIAFYLSVPKRFPCTMHGAFYDISVGSADQKIRDISRQRILQSMEIGKKLGVEAVVFHTNYIPNLTTTYYIQGWLDDNTEFFSSVLEAYAPMRVYIENMFDISPDLLARLAGRLCIYKNFGVCLDLAHASLASLPIEVWFEALSPFIRHYHLNDNDGKSDLHLPLGEGVLNIPLFFSCIDKYDAHGTLLLEVSGIEKQQKSLDYLTQKLPEAFNL